MIFVSHRCDFRFSRYRHSKRVGLISTVSLSSSQGRRHPLLPLSATDLFQARVNGGDQRETMTRRLSTTTAVAAATTTLTYASGGKKKFRSRRDVSQSALRTFLSEHFTDFVSREPIERYRGENKAHF